jgi:outer membrane murein-binding lipoprotein Lpp
MSSRRFEMLRLGAAVVGSVVPSGCMNWKEQMKDMLLRSEVTPLGVKLKMAVLSIHT